MGTQNSIPLGYSGSGIAVCRGPSAVVVTINTRASWFFDIHVRSDFHASIRILAKVLVEEVDDMGKKRNRCSSVIVVLAIYASCSQA